MVERVFIIKNQTANFICPMCQLSKAADVSKFVKSNKSVKIHVKCPCGHTFTSLLERRKNYRKKTKLAGSFVRFVEGKPADSGNLMVRDLSLTGLRLEVFENLSFSEGDVLEVDFQLDDPKRTLIKRKVVIRNIDRSNLGAEFLQTGTEDNALGFYLMP